MLSASSQIAKETEESKQDYKPRKRKQPNKNDPAFDVAAYAYQMAGNVDLTQIPGVGLTTILTMMSETGFDLSMFKSAKHFVSWLGFAPNRKISGGRQLSSKTNKQTNPLANVIREAANSAGNSKTRLGDFFRRLAFRKGRMVAIVATSRKIGVIIYKMLKDKQEYCYQYSNDDEQRIKNFKVKQIRKSIKTFNISKNELEAAFS